MHDPGKALDLEERCDPARAGHADAGDIVPGEVDQHHMFGRLLLVEPKIGLEPVVEVRGFAPRARSGHRPSFDDGPALIAMHPNRTFGTPANTTVPGPPNDKHEQAR